MEPFIGEIKLFAGNFAPRGWAFCDGQLLPINQWQALFSILGTMYGGDGRTTFALPDLRGRVSIHPGNGPGLSPYRVGDKGGAEQVTLTTAQIPPHTHSLNANTNTGDHPDPAGASLADTKGRDRDYLKIRRGEHVHVRTVDREHRRRATAREPAALPGRELHHCFGGNLPVEELAENLTGLKSKTGR